MGVGLNRSVPFYLTESYLISYEGCWFIDGGLIDACSWESVKDSTCTQESSYALGILPFQHTLRGRLRCRIRFVRI